MAVINKAVRENNADLRGSCSVEKISEYVCEYKGKSGITQPDYELLEGKNVLQKKKKFNKDSKLLKRKRRNYRVST